MNNELLATLEYIEQERGISKEQLMDAVEKAILTAARKTRAIVPAKELAVQMDRKTGAIRAWAKLQVVEGTPTEDQITLIEAKKRYPEAKLGDIVDWEVTPRNFGRIAAQTARQTILQYLRKAEKEIVQDEFKDQVGEIVNGNVRRVEAGNIIVDFQKAEGIIGVKDRVPGEQYHPGELINALLVRVDIETAGPSLILSRSSVNFVRKLFEREVSEIHDGVVEIVGIAREAGVRTKISVRSTDPRVDPVGACVGLRGLRVRNITDELSNERVDIIRYDEDLHTYLANAMQPAKILRVEEDRVRKLFTVHVDEENSRLAFGKKAQNVRLAQKLLQWTINIVIDQPEKEEDFEEKKARAVTSLAESLAVSEAQALILVDHGYLTVDGLRNAAAGELESLEGIEQSTLESISRVVNQGSTEA
ncbi:MAG: transcription termination/antitermination protein NusA [Lentisphaeria bacterium]|nr:transcription termination/antitermination protein NusA [Lentisphaeria bacterium]